MFLQTWREYLFGDRAWMGYDRFVTPPRTRHAVPCRVCGSRCVAARDRFSVPDPEAGLGGEPCLHDRFECPHRGESWHQEALQLVRTVESTGDEELQQRLWQQLEVLLRQHGMPDA